MFKDHLLFFSKFILITLILMILYLPAVQAQDTIVKRNNEKIVGKILDVDPTEIKYKRFDYQDGPTFTVVKWELKYIVYGNGIKESFESFAADLSFQPSGKYYYYKNQKILEPNMLDIAWKLQDKKINLAITQTEQIRFTKNCFLVGGIALATGGLLTSTGIFSGSSSRINISTVGGTANRRRGRTAARAQSRMVGGYMILGGIGCELVSVGFNIHEKKYAHIVVDLYNKAIL